MSRAAATPALGMSSPVVGGTRWGGTHPSPSRQCGESTRAATAGDGRRGRPVQPQAGLRSRLLQRHEGDRWAPSGGLLVPPKSPLCSGRWRGSLPREEARRSTGGEGEGLGESRPSPRQSEEPSPASLLARRAIRTRQTHLILLDPENTAAASRGAHEQHPGTRARGPDGSWQIWDGTCPTFSERAG